MRKNIFLIFIFFSLVLGSFNFTPPEFCFASSAGVEINFFISQTCPHCLEEKIFLDNLAKKYPQIEVKKIKTSENIPLLEKFYQKYKVPSNKQGFVPITFIAEKYFFGFDRKIGEEIENYILKLFRNQSFKPAEPEELSPPPPQEKRVQAPFFGEINLSKFPLWLSAIILGFFDGFNVCSLGALVLILGLVLSLKSREKAFVLGGTFILVSAIVYGVLIFLWHQIFVVFSPYLRKMELIVGLLALVGAFYFLKEFLRIKKEGPTCKLNNGLAVRVGQKIEEKFKKDKGILALIGAIFFFAFLITVIEFPCSAILPVLFAGLLCETHLPGFVCLFYIVLYLLFYLLDEVIVFIIAILTMKIWIASPRFMTWLNLLAAITLFFLGIYYLFGLV